MHIDWTAILVCVATIVVQLLVGAYVYGRLTEKVVGHEKRIGKLEDRAEDHGERIARLEAGR